MLYEIMERQLLRIGLALGFLLAGASSVAAGPVGAFCHSPKSIGGWIGDRDRVTNEIKAIEAIHAAQTGRVIGWFYQLNDRRTFFQPAFSYGNRIEPGRKPATFIVENDKTGGPLVPVSSLSAPAAADAIRRILETLSISDNALPQQFNDFVHHRLPVVILHCHWKKDGGVNQAAESRFAATSLRRTVPVSGSQTGLR